MTERGKLRQISILVITSRHSIHLLLIISFYQNTNRPLINFSICLSLSFYNIFVSNRFTSRRKINKFPNLIFSVKLLIFHPSHPLTMSSWQWRLMKRSWFVILMWRTQEIPFDLKIRWGTFSPTILHSKGSCETSIVRIFSPEWVLLLLYCTSLPLS